MTFSEGCGWRAKWKQRTLVHVLSQKPGNESVIPLSITWSSPVPTSWTRIGVCCTTHYSSPHHLYYDSFPTASLHTTVLQDCSDWILIRKSSAYSAPIWSAYKGQGLGPRITHQIITVNLLHYDGTAFARHVLYKKKDCGRYSKTHWTVFETLFI